MATRNKCPICAREHLPDDTSVASIESTRVLLQGRVKAVVRPEEAAYTPFGHYCTVSLYPRKGPVKYLKFRIAAEMDRWELKSEQRVQVEGCFHLVDGKELVFDITNVVIDPLT